MREILFRGKDFSGIIGYDWCFGSLDVAGNTIDQENPIIIVTFLQVF